MSEELVGWIFFGISSLGAFLYYLIKPKAYHAILLFGSLVTLGAIIPQLMKNSKSASDMQNAISPFFLVLYPVSIVCTLPDVFNALSKQEDKEGPYISLFGMTVRLILYSTWLIQYAVFDHYKDGAIVFAALLLFSLLFIFRKLYKIIYKEEETKTKMLF